jgi:hypothetical protein
MKNSKIDDAKAKAEIYQTLYQMNAAFASIVGHCRALHRTGLFRTRAVRLFPSFVQELQAEINMEFLNPLHTAEESDWVLHGKVRERWEKYLKAESKQRK